jgi:hypothetical protein
VQLPFRGVAQPGSALALGARGPRFESARPDQFYPELDISTQTTCQLDPPQQAGNALPTE